MNNVIMRKIIVTANYQPLSAVPLIGSVEISAAPMNAGSVFFKGDDSSDVPWVAGEFHALKSADLHTIQIRGTPGDVVSVVGGTW